jgi:hypothetical protein
MYENLQLQIKQCLENQRNQDSKSRLENIKKEVSCHKGMVHVWCENSFIFGISSPQFSATVEFAKI